MSMKVTTVYGRLADNFRWPVTWQSPMATITRVAVA